MPQPTIAIIFSTAFVIAFSGAMMPGPLLAYTITASASHGFWVGPLLILGHAILELSLVFALVFGLSSFIEGNLFTGIVGLAGGTVLVWMGFEMARQGWRKVPFPLQTGTSFPKSRRIVISGILVSMSNPYWFLWWATIGVTYLLWALDLGAAGIASFFIGHILADLVWYTMISFVVATGRRVINNTAYSWLLMTCGMVLAGLGGYFMASGIGSLTE